MIHFAGRSPQRGAFPERVPGVEVAVAPGACEQAGVDKELEQLLGLDPGGGFPNCARQEHGVDLLTQVRVLAELGHPGHH